MPMVQTQPAAEGEVARLITGSAEHADVKQLITGDEIFIALIDVALIHAVYACHEFPSVMFGIEVFDVIVEGMQLHVQTRHVGTLLKFLPPVLLIAHQRTEGPLADIEGIVQYRLVMMYLLEGQALGITVTVTAFTLGNAGREVIIVQYQMTVPPTLVHAQQGIGRPLTNLGAQHVIVILVFIGMCHLVRPSSVPYEPVVIAAEIHGIVKETIVGLI